MEWTTSEIQNNDIAKISIFIFLSVVLLGAFEVLPLVVASLIGVVSMITFKVLSVRQVLRSVDNNLSAFNCYISCFREKLYRLLEQQIFYQIGY